jgi:hypothetical protein
MRAPPPRFSQLTTSFVAALCLGIHRAPFLRLTGFLVPRSTDSFQVPRSRTTPFSHTRSCSLNTPTSPLDPYCQCSCFPSRHSGRRSAAPWAAKKFSGVEGMCANRSDARLVSAFCSEEPTRGSRKEVIQPQVPLRLPCYDFAPVIKLAFDRSVPSLRSGSVTGFGRSQLPWRDGRCVQGPGTYSPWCS